MLAMQYSIHLPQDFDAEAIHARVAHRRGLFETVPGMLHKSFLFNEEEHLYAPFYIWENSSTARAFLIDDLFKGVIESFSRPRVRSWLVIGMVHGQADVAPSFCLREADSIPVHDNLQELIEHERDLQAKLKSNPSLYMHALAIDPDRWELIRYSLWKDAASAPRPAADLVQEYQVLHVSEPKK